LSPFEKTHGRAVGKGKGVVEAGKSGGEGIYKRRCGVRGGRDEGGDGTGIFLEGVRRFRCLRLYGREQKEGRKVPRIKFVLLLEDKPFVL